MFKLFARKKVEADSHLYAPADGKIIDITDVADPVFSQKMMGEGFGVVPANGSIVSAVAGQVTMVAETGHAVGLKMANGLEVLMHFGIDTVELKGAPFSLRVKTGDILKGGDPIGSMDLEAVKKAGKGTTIIIAVTNSKDALKQIDIDKGEKKAGVAIGRVESR
ncbi:MAG: PTS glucose transporter subunit IIA [Sporolactobacillus sp.]|jgi:glucose-specific phosphotransferase system IIA component|nr:PTS glucose transporter subunit IIA [Sporolactobacillus sp.]MCI1882723.1 PTS glucose transporter subunit IIA [Sporolactobacillus sp.]